MVALLRSVGRDSGNSSTKRLQILKIFYCGTDIVIQMQEVSYSCTMYASQAAQCTCTCIAVYFLYFARSVHPVLWEALEDVML